MLSSGSRPWLQYVRWGFSLLYALVFFSYDLIPLRVAGLTNFPALYTLIAIVPLLLLVMDFLGKRRLLHIPFVDIILLFFLACLVSVLLNAEYGLAKNAKCLAWMGTQIFVLCSFDPKADDRALLTTFKVLTNAVIVLQTVATTWSLVQFVGGVSYLSPVSLNNAPVLLRTGFYDSRLFGVFIDPNYACLISLVALGFIVYNWKCAGFPKWVRVPYVFAALSLIFYVILSGSRTGLISLVVVAFFAVGGIVAVKLRTSSAMLRIVTFALAGVLAAVFSFGGYQITKTGLSYLPGIYHEWSTPDTAEPLPPSTDDPPADDLPVIPPPTDLQRPDVSEDISNHRFEIWADCLLLIKASPLFGTGPHTHLEFAADRFDDLYISQIGYSVHNGYLALFVGSGIIGGSLMLIWLIAIVVYILGYLIRRFQSRDQYYWPVFICTLLLLANAVSAFPLLALFFCNQSVDVLFWILLGFVFAFIHKSEPDRQKPSLVGKCCDSLFSRIAALFKKKT